MRPGGLAIIMVLVVASVSSAQPVEQLMADGLAAMDGGRFDEAVTLFRQVVSREPSNFEAQYQLGIAYLKLDRFDNADRELQKALSLAPRHGGAWFHLGEARYNRNDRDGTLGSLTKAVQYEPDNIRYRMRLAWVYMKYDAPARARDQYQHVADDHPAIADAWEGLAEAHEALKDYKPAVQAWKRCLEATRSPQKRKEIQARIDAIDQAA